MGRFRAQAMVEYALLISMVAVSLIVIMATLGDAVGTVWVAVIDSVQKSPLFEVKVEPPAGVATPTNTWTNTPTFTDTPNPAFTFTPTSTATEFIPPSVTPTRTDTLTPSVTATDTPVPTSVSSPTPVSVAISAVEFGRIYGKKNQIDVRINLRYPYDNSTVVINDVNYPNNKTTFTVPSFYGVVQMNVGSDAGFMHLTTSFGDDILIAYPAYPW